MSLMAELIDRVGNSIWFLTVSKDGAERGGGVAVTWRTVMAV